MECEIPRSIEHGSIVGCPEVLGFGDTCDVICDPGYDVSDLGQIRCVNRKIRMPKCFDNQTHICLDDCEFSKNGNCQDGFGAAESSWCNFGHDCLDCGLRRVDATGCKVALFDQRVIIPMNVTNGTTILPPYSVVKMSCVNPHHEITDDGLAICRGYKWNTPVCYDPETEFCDNTCHYPQDIACDDGGPGADFSVCDEGTDCSDCGAREKPHCDLVIPTDTGITHNCSDSLYEFQTCELRFPNGTVSMIPPHENSIVLQCDVMTGKIVPENYMIFYNPSVSVCKDHCVDDYGYSTPYGICEDGGPDSTYSLCAVGVDCTDCGPRPYVSGETCHSSHERCDGFKPKHCGLSLYDTDDFSSHEMCCQCGGGCVDTGNHTDSRGKTCNAYQVEDAAATCGVFDTADFNAMSDCCACPGGGDQQAGHQPICIDLAFYGAESSQEQGCLVYTHLPELCDNSIEDDDDDFTASEMCCMCGGGCRDPDNVTDSRGETCVNYTTWEMCGQYDTVEFDSSSMCCACIYNITEDAIQYSCQSTEGLAVDTWDDGCDAYVGNPSWCGGYDDGDFRSNEMCCACGGGVGYNVAVPGLCTDTDNGATDSYYDGCSEYTLHPEWCGGYDDDDFISNTMCCACGGGEGGGSGGGEDGDNQMTCSDTNNGATDSYEDTCEVYMFFPFWCGLYDDADFDSYSMCCGCGGGSISGDNGSGDGDGGGSDGGSGGDGCTDTDNGATDSYGDGCDVYSTFWCGEYDDDFDSLEMCCVCGGGLSCQDSNGNFTDSRGSNCEAYESSTEDCGLYDTSNFNASAMCCVCEFPNGDGNTGGGGSNLAFDNCTDLDGNATDVTEDGCVGYYGNAEDWCGSYDDTDFVSNEMCCACGGGCYDTSGDAVDSRGLNCSAYESNVGDCGVYDTEHFNASAMCCGCAHVSIDDSDDNSTDICYNLVPDEATDAYGNNCHDIAANLPVCYDDSAITDTFNPSTMCCACGGGTNECFDTNYGQTDAFGYDCVSLYDGSPDACGDFDSTLFTADNFCCACGGGSTHGYGA